MMRVGIPKEIKADEFRVGLTPYNVAQLVHEGHQVYVEQRAGEGSGYSDTAYRNAGAVVLESATELYAHATLIVKVKEPLPAEYELLNERHILFTYLHLAPAVELTEQLLKRGVTSIGYETVEKSGTLPLLKPMSEIAGKMSVLVGAEHLSSYKGGSGILIGGAVGVPPAKVLVIGAGNAGSNAARMAVGLGADVTVLNRSTPKLETLQWQLPSIKTALYAPALFPELLRESDLVISTVLIPGRITPQLIDRGMLMQMKRGSVFVDITVDQGGTAETSRATTHHAPTFVEEGVVHYCVTNMPGAYPKTATMALSNMTIGYVSEIAKHGFSDAVKKDPALACGVNTYRGEITNRAVAESLGMGYSPLSSLLE